MATTTPNFGWSVPTSTDYVKDGAVAIETLGDAIDASLVDLKGGTTGQVLSKNTNTDMDFTWVTPNDADAIQNTIVDAKGDLISATAADTPARLASSGVNGDVLTVDTSTATGLKWAASSAGAFVGCQVYLTADQSINHATHTALTFTNETYDTDGFHSNTTNTSRLTIPTGKGGYYRINAVARWNTSGTGRRIGYIYKNGTDICGFEATPNSSSLPSTINSITVNLADSDYLEFYVYQTSNNPLSVVGTATGATYFEIERVG